MQQFKLLKILLLLLLQALAIPATAQLGKISGVVRDGAKNEPLFGAMTMVEGGNRGTTTDFEGRYVLDKLQPGNYTLVFNSMGYGKKIISGVVVEANKTTRLDVSLEETSTEVGEVVIRATYNSESSLSLIEQRKNAAQISDGISADMIKKSPDNTTSDVMKRVPGADLSSTSICKGVQPLLVVTLKPGCTAGKISMALVCVTSLVQKPLKYVRLTL